MISIPGRIPISIHPIFWLVAALIGWFNSGSWVGALVWMGIILFSVLLHEMGHALTALACKLDPRIDLVAMGGVTSYESKNLPFWKQFFIVLNGPLFGVILFLGCWALLEWAGIKNPIVIQILTLTKLVNIFWTVVNLLPVLPLDGGQLLRIALEAWLGVKGVKLSLLVGMIVAFSIALYFIAMGGFLIGAIFFLFAFQAFDLWRRSRNMTKEDRDDNNTEILKQIETNLQEGNLSQAKRLCEQVRGKIHKGVVFVTATQYLALINYEQGDKKNAYELLLPLKDKVEQDALCLLQELAFNEGNYPLVAELSATCFQLSPSQEVALRNAKAFASLKKARPAGGWLRKALEFGRIDLKQILADKIFDAIRDEPLFKSFFDK